MINRIFSPRLAWSMVLATLLLVGCQSGPKAGLTAAQIALLKQEGFELVDEDWELSLSGKFLFGIDEYQLNNDSRASLQHLTGALLDAGIDAVRLDGHTDATGSHDYNVQLSRRRAEAVAEAMIASGMQRHRVEIRGLGATRPVRPGSSAEVRRENRRVAVVVSSR